MSEIRRGRIATVSGERCEVVARVTIMEYGTESAMSTNNLLSCDCETHYLVVVL